MQLKFMALIFISVFIVAVIIVLKVSNRKPQPKTKTKKIKSRSLKDNKKRAGLLTGGTLAVSGLSGFFLYNQYGLLALIGIVLVATVIIIGIINSVTGGIVTIFQKKPAPYVRPKIMDTDDVEGELQQQFEDTGWEGYDPATDPVDHSFVDVSEEEDTEYDTPTGRTPI